MRFIERLSPEKNPHFEKQIIAYVEQLGVNLQEWGRSGDMQYL